MKTIKLLALSAIVAGCITSCQKEEVAAEVNEINNTPTKEQLLKLESMGVNTEDVSVKTVTDLDGSTADYFVNDTDLGIPVAGLADQPSLGVMDNGMKQYRTRNLVSSNNRTINVLGYTGGGGNGLSNTGRQALQRAVNRYNSLNTSLNMRLTFGTNYQAADLVVYVRSDLGAGGLAGFPSGGRPYKWARIGPSVKNRGVAYTQHVIAHEMGHCIGLRHTDWQRRVCDGRPEGQGADGAIHIPGTPRGVDITSLMISCPAQGNPQNGTLNRNDVTALEYMY
ncbi:M57 family metalloprotease [Aquimarina megaterium]|uniref:M57 family metalloprotease n=1 Tax=Aquimarina megaterium TaxID=1443666 RepID=UPI0009422BCD|nr:M57 family metalloprotease [Aquimarina megaterium]